MACSNTPTRNKYFYTVIINHRGRTIWCIKGYRSVSILYKGERRISITKDRDKAVNTAKGIGMVFAYRVRIDMYHK